MPSVGYSFNFSHKIIIQCSYAHALNFTFCFVKKFLEYINLAFCCYRFGYDYAGGFEREMGGRPGYGDERPHGRHISRPFGGYSGHSGNCSTA